ncbi:replication initiation protein [Cytobacillus sp. FJAT-53684]|uniref:Replication initiation protein n=1 Tax=Cytobacillus mangrovibacter TaxID=3299024 RepID=A0ABW6K532_9BACI
MFQTEIIEVSNNKLVTKSNMLIEANYKLGVVEQKIILCLASNIHPSDSDFKTYTLPIKEFTKLLGLKGTPKYTELRQITKELMQKVFEVRINKKVIQVGWLSYVAYNETEGTIDIRFDPFLRPYLLELKREFTSYKLENVVKLKSSYAIRIYELLKQYEKIQERTFPIESLRKMLGAEDIYPAYGNFKQRVLVPAQKELKKKTDISFQIEEIKTGRRVSKIKFVIYPAKKKTEQLSLFEESLEEFKQPNSFSERVKKLGLMMGIRITDETIQAWEKFGQENVIVLMEKIQHRTDIENLIGYITTVLNASKGNVESEVATTSENQMILPFLVSYFRKSKEKVPNWFVKDKAVEELQTQFQVNVEEANAMFDSVKDELFEMLGVKDFKPETASKEDKMRKKKELEETLKKLRGN